MAGGSVPLGDVLLEGAAVLRRLLPADWTLRTVPEATAQPRASGGRFDALLEVQDPQGTYARLLVEAKEGLSPRDVDSQLVDQVRLLRRLDRGFLAVVFARWLSPRTRTILEAEGIGYLDLTGNINMVLPRPAVVLRTEGARHDPAPAPRAADVSVRGTRASRVVRLLADVQPPYTASMVAREADVSVPYASRLLTMLDREALVTRDRRGLVVDVAWQDLLRRRAETYSIFNANRVSGYLAGTGAREATAAVRDGRLPYLAVTGSFAAAQLAPVAAPAQLVCYVAAPVVPDPALGWLPTEQGSDVVLLEPYDPVVVKRLVIRDGLRVVAPAQLVLDTLSGNGRLPAEGEALLVWMAEHEGEWRAPAIGVLPPQQAAIA